jgi:hypothetical protein
MIAKGLGNLVLGSLKTITAANVTVIGGNVTGGGVPGAAKGAPVAAAGAGVASLLAPAAIAAAALAAVTIAGTEINKKLNPTGFNFNELAGGKGASRVQVEGDLLTLSRQMGVDIATLQERAIPLLQSGDRSWSEVVTELRKPGRSRGGSFDRGGTSSSDTTLLRQFGDKLEKLATNEVLEHLARTTEVGLKGVGTSFQVGIQTGLDPIGDVATRILARAEDPKASPVMAEIKGHLLGLEEIQAAYLERGDIKLADKVQANIDTLHELIGTTDSVRAVTAHLADQAISSDQAMLATAQETIRRLDTGNSLNGAQLQRQADALAAARATTSEVGRLASTPHNVNVDTHVTVNTSVGVSVLQQQAYREHTVYNRDSVSTNSGGF